MLGPSCMAMLGPSGMAMPGPSGMAMREPPGMAMFGRRLAWQCLGRLALQCLSADVHHIPDNLIFSAAGHLRLTYSDCLTYFTTVQR